MKTRIITAVVALAVFVGVLLAPPVVFSVALAAVIFMMLYECYNATRADMAMKITGFVSAALLMALIYVQANRTAVLYSLFSPLAVIILIIIIYMALTIALHGKKEYRDVLASGFITFYIVLSTACIWLAKERSTYLMIFIFICAWGTDTFAYFSGKLFGKHKLIPRVSPNKTVEGSIGGVIGSMVLCALYILIFNKILGRPFYASGLLNQEINWSPLLMVFGLILGGIGGAASQLGDLAASAIKRDTGIKDFGRIFPGHGGFMDRFDSVIFVSPVVYGIIYLILYYFMVFKVLH